MISHGVNVFFFWGICLFLVSSTASAADPLLNYSNRNQAYSGWSGAVRGDLRTIGMAGALVGLGDSWAGATYNPAGLGLTLGYTGAQINTNRIKDGFVQTEDQEVRTSNYGAFASTYPWGFAMGYWSPQKVGARYGLPNNGGTITHQHVVDEFRVSAARSFFDHKLAVGLGLIYGQGRAELGFPGNTSANRQEKNASLSGSLGVLYQLDKRILLGLSFTLPVTYKIGGRQPNTPGISNYFQDIKSPAIIGLGIGWIPNNIFRAGFSVMRISATENTALFSDQNRAVGASATYQPSFGIEYRWADFKNFQGKVNLGSYLEAARLSDIGPRFHWTGAFEANPYIFNLGFAYDRGSNYRNSIFSFGIDILRTLRWIDVIPQESRRVYRRWFANPFRYSDNGLPRTLVTNWDGSGSTPGEIIDIGKQIPKRLGKKVDTTFKNLGKFIKGEDGKKVRKKKKRQRKKNLKGKGVSKKNSTTKNNRKKNLLKKRSKNVRTTKSQ